MTTRRSQAEVVFLRFEANRVNPCINLSVRTHFKNARVFRDGKAEGFDNKVERNDKVASCSRASVSRAGKADG